MCRWKVHPFVPEPRETPRPHEVTPGYSRPRPELTWRYRIVVGLVGLLGIGAVAGFASMTYASIPPTWDERPPEVTLSAAEVAAAQAVPSYDGAVPVLAYHFVTSRTDGGIDGPYTVTAETFATQMAALDEAGFTTVTAQQVEDFTEGAVPLPDKPILITFDDGHATNRHVVDPILARHNFTAVGFLITGRIENDEAGFHLTLADVQALEETGRWEFGSHSHALHRHGEGGDGSEVTALDHRVRTQSGELETLAEYAERIDADLSASRSWLELHVNEPVPQFSYPMGGRGAQGSPDLEATLHATLREHGFGFAYTVTEHEESHSLVPTTATMAQPRIGVYRDTDTLQLLEEIVESLPIDQGGEQPTGWFDGWVDGS